MTGSDSPPRRHTTLDVVLALLGWVLGLALAWHFSWTTTDLLWGLWLSSLFLGFAMIVVELASGLLATHRFWAQHAESKPSLGKGLLVVSVIHLAVLVFMSFHFCAFHSIHAFFLTKLFPPPAVHVPSIGDWIFQPTRIFGWAISTLFPTYGVVLASTALAEARHFYEPFRDLDRRVERQRARLHQEQNASGGDRSRKRKRESAHANAYRNVAKLHFLIIALGFTHIAGFDDFGVFAAVYAAYFFPWGAAYQRLRNTD